jgi:outer membrane protein assembly factor BamB
LCVDWKQAKILWTYSDERSSQGFRSSPAATEQAVVVGGRNRRIQAFAPDTGKELWSFAAKTRVDASPVIVGSRVFAAAADGRLYALELQTGKLLWEHQAAGGFAGSPAVAANRLVIASDQGVVYCFGR